MKRFFRENDFSVYTDPETGEIVCKMIPKDMDAERTCSAAYSPCRSHGF